MLISFLQSVKLIESDFCMHHIVKLLILLTVDYQILKKKKKKSQLIIKYRIYTHKAD